MHNSCTSAHDTQIETKSGIVMKSTSNASTFVHVSRQIHFRFMKILFMHHKQLYGPPHYHRFIINNHQEHKRDNNGKCDVLRVESRSLFQARHEARQKEAK